MLKIVRKGSFMLCGFFSDHTVESCPESRLWLLLSFTSHACSHGYRFLKILDGQGAIVYPVVGPAATRAFQQHSIERLCM